MPVVDRTVIVGYIDQPQELAPVVESIFVLGPVDILAGHIATVSPQLAVLESGDRASARFLVVVASSVGALGHTAAAGPEVLIA